MPTKHSIHCEMCPTINFPFQVVRPLSIAAAGPSGTCATGNGQVVRCACCDWVTGQVASMSHEK